MSNAFKPSGISAKSAQDKRQAALSEQLAKLFEAQFPQTQDQIRLQGELMPDLRSALMRAFGASGDGSGRAARAEREAMRRALANFRRLSAGGEARLARAAYVDALNRGTDASNSLVAQASDPAHMREVAKSLAALYSLATPGLQSSGRLAALLRNEPTVKLGPSLVDTVGSVSGLAADLKRLFG